jgi:restriction system protein
MPRKSTPEEIVELIELFCSCLPFWMVPVVSVGVSAISYWILLNLFSLFASVANGVLMVIPLFGSLFFGIVAFFAGLRGWRSAQRRKELQAHTQTVEDLRRLDWRSFELLVADYYRSIGYHVVEGKGNVPDGGIDIQMRSPNGQLVLVQCKHWKSSNIGVKVVREMLGVLQKTGAHKALIIGIGGFTQEAIAFSNGQPIELLDGSTFICIKRGAHLSKVIIPSRSEYGQCPKCGKDLVQRIAKKGPQSGSTFIGCSGFPSCRYTRRD